MLLSLVISTFTSINLLDFCQAGVKNKICELAEINLQWTWLPHCQTYCPILPLPNRRFFHSQIKSTILKLNVIPSLVIPSSSSLEALAAFLCINTLLDACHMPSIILSFLSRKHVLCIWIMDNTQKVMWYRHPSLFLPSGILTNKTFLFSYLSI